MADEAVFARAWMIFLERIEKKNSWGKNELHKMALDCVMEAAAEQVKGRLHVGTDTG